MTLEAYYSQVVQALGNVGATHSAVAVLKEAVRRSDPTLPTTSVLWSLLFKHQTQLGHFHSAYSTMLAIPDRRRWAPQCVVSVCVCVCVCECVFTCFHFHVCVRVCLCVQAT